MVSQELPKESISSVLQQCPISNMNECRSRSGGLCYCSHCNCVNRPLVRPHSLPASFQPHGLQSCRSMEPFSGRLKEDDLPVFGRVHNHGLSLSLGPELEPNNVRPYNYNQEHVMRNKSVIGVICEPPPCSCAKYSRDEGMVCDQDVDSNNYTLSCLNSAAPFIDGLQKSPYLKAARELLDEVVCVSNKSVVEPSSEKNAQRKNQIKGNSHNAQLSWEEEEMSRINKLLALQEELEKRQKIYFHQMDELVASFEAVGGPGSAATYTALTTQAMSKHFSNLRESILSHMDSSREAFPKDGSKNHKPKRESLQHLGMIHVRQIWRPLRGLPEDSVMVLRAWLFEHFLHPYPSDNEKLLLASKTGLTRNQISNWFINARVRLWKPMIEEMYKEEFAEEQEDSNPSF
ncbi:BEL1-like homeodomain protein 11 [Phalaenopsis equestris]|uniref:BEL1-like homeodomain protein 11 n=1 Tax=Phalaenopsis equestris TaxID=78828 RepID=UPI0009E324CB|nr:BEL1-like homeodomain protein 11 [Phalaenopsis equestris]XP_020580093.1 BEL1-like homeodomain protein 11 [Phalaenopsis equestris]XP_020580094.1 BEL1-like homeodomain protein 11 [Phalaenopsis equestris]XP_020580095.1 BEL1-like homeodomain protein 11 [Phalaenopsis equestris]XP_020580096.1 BEL1-like homeodomain protein 11 [Phalaenopsis equestris]XP_020580098.1 BEL1-like homeodomain protein 11 [Phalaenopsis equestris]XP_020580099.1 BEL1-like homeodomain protein 11 [Phalaenopsis equestris]